MNPFEALGVAYRASVGQHIIVMFTRPEQIKQAVDDVAEQARYISDQVEVISSGGDRRVQVNRGEIVFTFRKSKLTDNYSADAVLTDAFAMSDTELGRLQTLVAERGGQVVTR